MVTGILSTDPFKLSVEKDNYTWMQNCGSPEPKMSTYGVSETRKCFAFNIYRVIF